MTTQDGARAAREDEPLFDVTAWDHSNGDVVKVFRDVTADEADRLRDEWEGDERMLTVVVEDR